MKKASYLILAASLMGLNSAAYASEEPKGEADAWTYFTLDNQLKALPKGDPIKGKQTHEMMMCNACHGEKGESPSRNYASINGQPEAYTAKMLIDYRDGRRWENFKQANIMVKLSRALDDQQIADLAAFYAQNALVVSNPQPNQPADIDKLVRKGDASRMLTPCASCHGVHGEGNGTVPALAGQVPEYFIRTMQAYKDGQRDNDVHKTMSQFTHDLNDEEIRALAHYYATMPIKESK